MPNNRGNTSTFFLATDWWSRAAWPKAVVLSTMVVCLAVVVIVWIRSGRNL